MAFPDYDYDVYEDFEDALGAGWTETDVDNNIDVNDVAAKYYGTQGYSYNWNGDTAGMDLSNVSYDIGSGKSDLSVGFWYYLPSSASGTHNIVIFSFQSSAPGVIVRLYYRRSGSTYYLRTRGTGYSANLKTMPSADAWYWVTIDFNQNDTCTLRIYNTSETEVDAGTSVTVTAADTACQILTWGILSGAYDENVDMYFDDIVADWTDATFPLLGWETAAPSGIVQQSTAYALKHKKAVDGQLIPGVIRSRLRRIKDAIFKRSNFRKSQTWAYS